jgi:hypothetical protein
MEPRISKTSLHPPRSTLWTLLLDTLCRRSVIPLAVWMPINNCLGQGWVFFQWKPEQSERPRGDSVVGPWTSSAGPAGFPQGKGKGHPVYGTYNHVTDRHYEVLDACKYRTLLKSHNTDGLKLFMSGTGPFFMKGECVIAINEKQKKKTATNSLPRCSPFFSAKQPAQTH